MMPNFTMHYNQGYTARPAPATITLSTWDSYWVKQSLATHNFLASALGFEPTDHSDAPPYIPATPTTKPQPCVDFGFEPTEASE